MSQFTLAADPNATNAAAINAVVAQFNALNGASAFLNISTQKGSVIYVTDNPNSPIVTPGNRAYLGTIAGYRALDQTKSSNNVIIFNPNPPDGKPLLNSLIHEIGHEKWPGLGNDATQHDPLFYALLNNALHALGLAVDPNQDLQGVDISNVVLPPAAINNPLGYNRPASHADLDSNETQFATNDPGTWQVSYSGSTLTETQTINGQTAQTLTYNYDVSGNINQETSASPNVSSNIVYAFDGSGNQTVTNNYSNSQSGASYTDVTTWTPSGSTDAISGNGAVVNQDDNSGNTSLFSGVNNYINSIGNVVLAPLIHEAVQERLAGVA